MFAKQFGLTEQELQSIIMVFKAYPEIEKGVIYGSRAKGNYKRGSDIDIALFGHQLPVTEISYKLNEETLLPYFFDILDYTKISNPDLKDHIDRVGITFYQK